MSVSLRLILLASVCAGLAWGSPDFVRLPEVPAELRASAEAWGGLPNELEKIQLPTVPLRLVSHQKLSAVPVGAKALLVPEMPALPVLLKKIPLQPGMTATAFFAHEQVDATTTAVNLETVPKEFVWSGEGKLDFNSSHHSRYFPGKFLTSSVNGSVLSVTIFPVQYDRETGRLLTLRSADLFVAASEKPLSIRLPRIWSPPLLILTSEAMVPAAKLIQDFDLLKSGIQSEVVTVESIDKLETAVSDDDLPDGYKTRALADDTVVPYDPDTKKGYHYELAKKIIHYLQPKMAEGSSLKYVMLLGDATMVPPSYYFSAGGQLGVTDACYGATEKCLAPKLAVGRLPFSSIDDVKNYLSKVTRWMAYASQASSELGLYGGKAFPTNVYIAELGALKTINSESDNWRGVQKFFRTRQNYTKQNVMKLVQGNSTAPLIYYLDHGGGNVWGVETESVSSREIEEAQDAGAEVNPFIGSIACTNAAFDNQLLRYSIFTGSHNGEDSVGVALLKSKAGAIGYLGSARPALGQPVYEVDAQGNLTITGTTYGLQLLDTFFTGYERRGGGRVGDALLSSLQAYVSENGNNMGRADNRYAYFNEALLGDPSLQFPTRNKVEENFGFASSKTDFPEQTSRIFPEIVLGRDTSPFDLVFDAKTNVMGTLIKAAVDVYDNDEVISQQSFEGSGQVAAKFEKESSLGHYFLRIENEQGVPMERQVWFEVAQQ